MIRYILLTLQLLIICCISFYLISLEKEVFSVVFLAILIQFAITLRKYSVLSILFFLSQLILLLFILIPYLGYIFALSYLAYSLVACLFLLSSNVGVFTPYTIKTKEWDAKTSRKVFNATSNQFKPKKRKKYNKSKENIKEAEFKEK